MNENVTGRRIRELREKLGMTQDELAEALGMNRANISNYERGTITNIPSDALNKMADQFKTNVDYILGRTDDPSIQPYYTLTPKEERDIAFRLQNMMDEIESDASLAFMGEEMDEEDRELLRISLENTLRISKQLAKKKFTPKKYRK